MTPELGTGLVLLSLLAACAGSVLGFYAGYTRHLGAWALARKAAWVFALAMLASNVLMEFALLTHDFSVRYVSQVGSLDTPITFTIVSLWASLNGSILFWGGILSLYIIGFLVTEGTRHREYMPYTLGVLLANAVFFALLVGGIANPFARISPIPLDGPGPNPLLQNHWLMIAHPPMLYLGYVGMSIPFAMICAALLAGRLDAGWMYPLRRWMLIPWTFLTVGIVMGGWWSYAVLGWGGSWAWDPVENASFHPWLTGTAFLHSAMVFQRRGTLRVWTLVLGMATFLLTLLGTFMTRSGVFNSVHSFTQSDIGPVFLVYIGITLLFSIVLLALREETLAFEPDQHNAQTSLMAALVKRGWHPLGREFALLLQNTVFTVFTFMVLLGTLYPLIIEALDGRKMSVGEPYFNRQAVPLGLLIVFLIGVGPALPWGRIAPKRALEKLTAPLITATIAGVAIALAGYASPMTIFTAALCGFALAANAAELITPIRARMRARHEPLTTATAQVLTRTRRRFGGHLAHYGVLIAVISLMLSKGWKQEVDVTLHPGETVELGGWSATFNSVSRTREPHRTAVAANFAIAHHGKAQGSLSPRLNYYNNQREPVYTPDIRPTLTTDFYLSVIELGAEGEYVVLRTMVMPGASWLWLSPLLIALGSLIAILPERKRRTAPAHIPAHTEIA